MKTILLLVTLVTSLISMASLAGDNFSRRYKTSYSSFDSSFHRQYSYREANTNCRYNTCMSSTFSRTQTVYVQETVVHHRVHGKRRMVRVYNDRHYKKEVVTYYVENKRRRVVARRYNRHHGHYRTHYHHHYYRPYLMPGLAITSSILDDFDSASGALLLTGAVVTDFGLNLATACRTQECLDAAGILAVAGIASSVSASISNAVGEKNRRTELELLCADADSDYSDDI